MAGLEELFASMRLGVIVPETFHDLPDDVDENWLHLVENEAQREKAFFDERLFLFFTVKLPNPTDDDVDPRKPPSQLAQFLSRLQIALDAKYISTPPPRPNRTSSHPSGIINVGLPPRSHSYNQGNAKNNPPPIFPPHTPNPIPQMTEADRKYAGTTEGTILESFAWGETARDEPEGRKFALLWSSSEISWVAIYRLTVGIAFLRTSSPEPVLSLTASATLREKPLAITPDRQALAEVLQAADARSDAADQTASTPINGSADKIHADELHGLQEVNLLSGLALGSPLPGQEGSSLNFPTTRLGASYRRTTFSLHPIQPASAGAGPTPPSATVSPVVSRTTNVLKRSFMKTLQTVSGFQIRMKSVFVPYVAIPGTTEDEEERREAGAEERTVVLSVELANGSSFAGPGATGFNVENIEVSVGGEGAEAHLITWEKEGGQKGESVFPIIIGPAEQFNLLYAITFLRQSEVDEVADTLRQDANAERLRPSGRLDVQRPVSIIVQGKPFDLWASNEKGLRNLESQSLETLSFPTKTFRSRWNCVLDLSPNSQGESFDGSYDQPSSADALPAPATPFPAATPTTARYFNDKSTVSTSIPQDPIVAGKRHTFGAVAEPAHRMFNAGSYRNSTSILPASARIMAESPISSRPVSPRSTLSNARFTPTLPSIVVKGHARFSSTTAITNIPSPQLPPQTPGPNAGLPPPTPAYPAYPVDGLPPTPAGQSPISSHRYSMAGSSIEPKRERLSTLMSPDTPGPRMIGSYFPDAFPEEPEDGEPIVVSIALMPKADYTAPELIYTLDTFGVEIFVFNRSGRTRRFEVSYPDMKRRRQQIASEGYTTVDLDSRKGPGLVSLDNRIRVGPLRPHTCQSVRMQFLALRPGVHSIASLTLADTETGFTKNLKSVMDVVVHDLNETKLLRNTSASISLLAQ
ncbi:hypothetical protein M422DRAFT_251317 [Sphaerobolus stellatus SS14]|uniref:Trafficking protein particle complex II-specific subunit 65 IgD3 domain-containing protein n=1 Tax=Sphaerobolus stellatus (strain SS14) TaxID=990650 RepID=A0A0C9UQB8_SPHS4|nr:hypothetical protein M422DRAFT_251317 [Sphaerobolus stellatus SS14]